MAGPAALAARSYTSAEIKPLLEDRLHKKFLPQTVPSYAATQSFSKMQAAFKDYSYKEATLTRPIRATAWWNGKPMSCAIYVINQI